MSALRDEHRTAYLDESRRRDTYALAALLVAPRERRVLRRVGQDLLLPGESRFHMSKERPRRRREAIKSIRTAGVKGLVVLTSVCAAGSEEDARRDCLEALVPALAKKRVAELCIESRDEVRDGKDRRVIRSLVERRGIVLPYEHCKASDEQLLWIADILAWTASNRDARPRLWPSIDVLRVRP